MASTDGATDNFGKQCLMARKLVEAGVRFVEVSFGNWDQHRNLKADMERNCRAIDKPIARPAHGLEAARSAEGHVGHLGR